MTDVVTEAVFKTSDGKAMPWDNLVALYGYFTDDCLAIAPLENFKWAEEHCSTSAYRGVCESPLGKLLIMQKLLVLTYYRHILNFQLH